MRGWILSLVLSVAFAQLPAVIRLPSTQSVAYDLRPIALGPVPMSISVNPATVAALGPVPLIFPLCLGLASPGVGQPPQPCANGCDPAFATVLGAAYVPATGTINFAPGPWPSATAVALGAWTLPITEIGGPRSLCRADILTPLFDVNGRPFQLQAAYDCSPGNALGAANIPAAACTSAARVTALSGIANGARLAVLLGQTQCCVVATGAGTPVFPQVTGVCINPNQETCCGNTPITPAQQCCSATTAGLPTVFPLATPCPCGGPVAGGAPPGTLTLACPGSLSCCRRSRFTFDANSFGICFDPSFHSCCDTGDVFDPAVQQCCAINGLQSANIPCPCSEDIHCQTSAFPTPVGGPAQHVRKSMACCRQTAPPLGPAYSCNAFDNFPTGVGSVWEGAPPEIVGQAGAVGGIPRDALARRRIPDPLRTQRCSGFCIDLNYQICCNGVACIREFEKCCNDTCCNTFIGTCAVGFRPGALGNRWSGREYRVPYEQCSYVEVTTSINVFWIYILPTALLLATLLGFAIALAFANIAARGRLSLLEKMIIFFAVFALLCACLLFFAPVYKYGILTVIVCLLAIITAAARVRWLNVFFIAAVIVLLWYIIDPLDGNDFWGIGYRRLSSGKPDPWASGMWHTTRSLWHNITQVNDIENWCVDFYDYFRYDATLRDEQRLHNPVVTTFGYCSRGWVFALLIMEGFITLSLFLLLLLGLIALVLRFRKMAFDPIELEIVNG